MAVRSTTLALENLESRLNLSTLAGAEFVNAFSRSGYSQERALFSAKTKVISLSGAAKKATASPLTALAGATSPAPAVSVSATTKSITVAWVNNSSNDTGFHIYRSTDGVNFKLLGNAAANKSSYTDTTAALGVSYIYRVTAYNKSTSTASGASQTVSLALPPAPAAPSNLVDSRSTLNSITLAWKDNASNETGYHVYRSTDGTNYTLLTTLKPNAKNFTDTKLQSGTTYFYEVSAFNPGGETYAPTPFTAATLAAPPVAPTNLAFSNVGGNGVTLNWSEASSSVTGYRIYRSSNGKTFTLVGNVDGNTHTFSDTGLNPLSTYSYEVSAFNTSANVLSKAASVSTLMAAPNAPGSLAFTNVTTDSLTLSWTPTSTNQTSFNIYRSSDGSDTALVGTVTGTTFQFTDTGLNAAASYEYTVAAVNSGGQTLSLAADATTATPSTSPAQSGPVTSDPTTPVIVAPSAPSTPTVSNLTTSSLTLTWTDDAANQTGLHIYRSTDATNYTDVADLSADATSWTDSNLTAGTGYFYKIGSWNSAGETTTSMLGVSTLAAPVTPVTPIVVAPNAPTSPTFTNVTTTSATLHWSDTGDITGFNVYRSTDGTHYTVVQTLSPGETTWTDTTLASGTTYTYAVSAFNSAGETGSNGSSVSTLVVPPNAPAGVTFAAVATNGVTVNWTPSANETGYNVYRTVDGLNYTLVATTNAATTTFTDSGLNANTTYAYEISAFNLGGETKSQPAAVSTLVAAPNVPGSVAFTNVTTSSATLNWSTPAAGGQTGYHVYRSTDGVNYTLVSTLGSTANAWTDTTLAANSTYDYVVGAFNTTGESTTSAAAVSTLVAAPNAPAGVTFTNVTTSALTVNWSASNNETGYRVYRTTDGTNYSLVATTNNTTTSWTDTSVTAGITYAYKVGAFNSTGETPSLAAAVSTLIAAPNTPGSLAFTNVTSSSATLNWTAPIGGGQTGYHVYRSTNGTNYSLVGTLTAGVTTWTDTALASGSTYFYALGAFNGTGESTTPGASVSTLVAAPNAPAGINFTNITSSALTLNWSAAPAAAGYHVYRSTDGTNFTLVGTLNASATNWSDSGLASNSSYYYSVGAFNSGGETRSANAFATTLVVAPNTPASPTFTNVTTTGLTLNWNPTATATGYRIYRSTDGANFTLVATAGASATNWTDSGLAGSTTYYYEVGAFNTGGEARSAAASTVTQTAVVASAPVTFSTLNQTSFNELDITGTTGNDTIVVTQANNVLTIVANGVTTTEPASFGDIKIMGVNGNDTITVQSSVNIATLIYGGDGNDIINNLTTGKATIVTIGNGANTVTGNGINTSYWVNPTDTVHASAAEIALGGVNKVAGFYENVSRNLYGQNLTDPTDSGAETRLTNSSFWGTGPSMNDINQTGLADCYFEAPLAALAYSEPQRLMNMGVDLGDGTYAVRFYSGGTATYVRVDGDLSTGYWNYGLGNQTPGADGNEWGSIFEKAYAFFRSGANTYASLNYGYQGQTFTDLGVASSASFPTLTSAATMLSLVNTQLAAGHSVVASTNASITAGAPIVESHVYTIVGAYMSNGTLMIQMRNPWGIDGFNDDSNPNDGLVTVAYSTFTANFNMVNYTTV